MNLHFGMPSSPLRFSSKADTLAQLANHEDLHVPPVYTFTTVPWQDDKSSVLGVVTESFSGRILPSAVPAIVRTATSLLDVPADESDRLTLALEIVLASYGDPAADEQVLIQPMIPDIIVSGVVMTRVHGDVSQRRCHIDGPLHGSIPFVFAPR